MALRVYKCTRCFCSSALLFRYSVNFCVLYLFALIVGIFDVFITLKRVPGFWNQRLPCGTYLASIYIDVCVCVCLQLMDYDEISCNAHTHTQSVCVCVYKAITIQHLNLFAFVDHNWSALHKVYRMLHDEWMTVGIQITNINVQNKHENWARYDDGIALHFHHFYHLQSFRFSFVEFRRCIEREKKKN